MDKLASWKTKGVTVLKTTPELEARKVVDLDAAFDAFQEALFFREAMQRVLM